MMLHFSRVRRRETLNDLLALESLPGQPRGLGEKATRPGSEGIKTCI